MFSSPAFSRIDAAVIIVLLCGGTAALVESRHRILIVAPADPDEVSSTTLTSANFVIGPTGDPMLTLENAQPWGPASERVNDGAE